MFGSSHSGLIDSADSCVKQFTLVQDVATGISLACLLAQGTYLCCCFVGMTPQRREFSYPSQLTRTKPHSELLEEFRSTAKSLALTELTESDVEFESEKSVHVRIPFSVCNN